MVTLAQAKTRLDLIIAKGRIDLYKPTECVNYDCWKIEKRCGQKKLMIGKSRRDRKRNLVSIDVDLNKVK